MRKGQISSCGGGCPFTPLEDGELAVFRGLVARTPPVRNSWFLGKIVYYQRYIDPKRRRQIGVKKICRFSPSCSEYSKDAITKYGAFSGLLRTAWRIMRCNPFSRGGNDPV